MQLVYYIQLIYFRTYITYFRTVSYAYWNPWIIELSALLNQTETYR